MRKYFYIIICLLVLIGCAKKADEKSAIVIGDIKISAKEFEEELALSKFPVDNPQSREEFLNRFVTRKLILREAEKMGLDKNEQFLQSVQLFWEQALLKLVLAHKNVEYMQNMQIGDGEIKAYFDKYKDTTFTGKTIEDVYKQIQWLLLKEKQALQIQSWVSSLQEKAYIDVDYKALGIEK